MFLTSWSLNGFFANSNLPNLNLFGWHTSTCFEVYNPGKTLSILPERYAPVIELHPLDKAKSFNCNNLSQM